MKRSQKIDKKHHNTNNKKRRKKKHEGVKNKKKKKKKGSACSVKTPKPYNKKRKPKKKKIEKGKIGLSVVLTCILYLIVFNVFFRVGKMNGYSMLPTLGNENIVTVNRFSTVKRFDIVYMKNPDKPNEMVIRRVIGLPGEELYYKDDELYINGEGKSEPYLTDKKKMMEPMMLTDNFKLSDVSNSQSIPEKHYFVIGDNRLSSRDSRTYGTVPSKLIIGKVSARIFPFSMIKIF